MRLGGKGSYWPESGLLKIEIIKDLQLLSPRLHYGNEWQSKEENKIFGEGEGKKLRGHLYGTELTEKYKRTRIRKSGSFTSFQG